MSPLVRWCAAALLIAGGLQLSGWVRGLTAHANTNQGRLGFEMMGIEVGLLSVAIALAWAMPGRIPDRLGLRAPRLPLHAVVALVIGTLGLSHTLHALIALSQVGEGSVVTGIPRAIARTAAAPRPELWIALLGSVIAPAVGEELLCRGLVQRTIVRWTGPGLAIAVASVVFGMIHTEWIHGTFAFLIGLYLGLAAYWADSSWPAIAAHAANNLGAVLGAMGLLVVPMPLSLALFGGAAVAALGLAWAARFRPRGTEAPASDSAPDGLQPDAESADA